MTTAKVAVITGANQGIGYGIAHRLTRLYSSSHFAGSPPSPLTIFFTSRSEERGQASLKELTEELSNEKPNPLADGLIKLRYHQLDITDASSRAALLQTLQKEKTPLNLLVNNAGIALEGFDAKMTEETLATNYWATKDMIIEALPQMAKDGRVVTLASMAGKLNGYSDERVQQFTSASTVKDVDTLMSSFLSSVQAGTYQKDGWKGAAYSVSKAGVIALHRALAQQLQQGALGQVAQGVEVYSCCPGYVSSRMTKQKGHLTLDEGAATPVTLALEDLSGSKSGTFWERQKESSW
ncbi:carbonyl reductase [Microstroma glucosiphilum]|uniref:Carbonyl reductase n=1 Tax=Pseudomicrostroma glucosiphilum TaxID=1684307 RepID=A0A316UEU9_9BASI|nr:carbonyl reductase [Pseudomicrostroma glucosiphilum]PWN21645.1 carbonyl reductase [Pseudomicrostroma glucosiphilum]